MMIGSLPLSILSSTNNFPNLPGEFALHRVSHLVFLGINKPPVAIEHIEKSIAEYAFENGLIKANPPKSEDR